MKWHSIYIVCTLFFQMSDTNLNHSNNVSWALLLLLHYCNELVLTTMMRSQFMVVFALSPTAHPLAPGARWWYNTIIVSCKQSFTYTRHTAIVLKQGELYHPPQFQWVSSQVYICSVPSHIPRPCAALAWSYSAPDSSFGYTRLSASWGEIILTMNKL